MTAPDGAKVVIPAGALDGARTITITSSATVPAGYVGYSDLYEFGPAGLQFSVPIQVTLPMRAGATSPAVYWSRASGAGFDELGGTASGNAMTASVTHFSQGFVAMAGGPTDGGADAAPTDAGSDAVAPDGGTAGAGGGAAGSGGAAGAGAAGAGGAPACTFVDAPVLDTKPMVGLPAPGGVSTAAGNVLRLSADGSLHLLGTNIFSAPDGKTFAPNNHAAAGGPFVVDTQNNWIYLAQPDATNKMAIFRYPTSGGCLQKVYTFVDDVMPPVPLGVTNGDVVFAAGTKNTNSSTVYVGAKGLTWTVGGKNALTNASNNLATNGAFSPSNPKRLWVGGRTTSALGWVAVSTDAGQTFATHPVPSGTILIGAGEAFVAPDPTDELTAYAMVNGGSGGVYKTVDGGTSWTLANKLASPPNESVDGLQIGADSTLYATTSAGTTGAVGFYKRAPGATAWTAFNGDLPAGQTPTRGFALREKTGSPSSIVRLATSGFLWRSDDGGATYTKIPVTGLPALTAAALGTDPDSATTFYANDPTFHLWKTVDAGKTFTAVAVGYTGFAIALPGGELIISGQPDTGGAGAAVFHSSDGGATVLPGGVGLPVDAARLQSNSTTPFVVGKAAKTAYLMYGLEGMDAASRGILFVTTDGGATWAPSGTFLPAPDSGQGVVLADPVTAHRLYRFMTPNNADTTFSISANDGALWTDTALPAPQGGGSIMLSPQDVFIDHTGRLYIKMFSISTLPSGSTTWQPITGSTGTLAVVGNYLYVGNARSSDGGATFKGITSLADYSFDWTLTAAAFAHRADSTFWLSDASGTTTRTLGVVVGKIP